MTTSEGIGTNTIEELEFKNGAALITSVTTPLEDKIRIARELFPSARKKELLKSASLDSKGRQVRYFRWMSQEELKELLLPSISNPHHLVVAEMFSKKKEEIKRALLSFLKENELEDKLSSDVRELEENFTLENYRRFIYTKLPLLELFRLQISASGGGMYDGLTGLISCSVGAPFLPPSKPSQGNEFKDIPIVEMVIPDKDIHVHPLFKTLNIEMEKEVVATQLRKEWITDIYLIEEDMAERLLKDPRSPAHPFFEAKTEKHGFFELTPSPFDTLQEWKISESIAECIPVSKLADIDESNPILQKPLFENKP